MSEEEILIKQAKKYMIYFDIKKFKKDYPSLYKTIIESIKYAKQESLLEKRL